MACRATLVRGNRGDYMPMPAMRVGRSLHQRTPLYRPASHIVYAARGSDVIHVMVNGRLVVENRRLLSFDVQPVMAQVNAMAGQSV